MKKTLALALAAVLLLLSLTSCKFSIGSNNNNNNTNNNTDVTTDGATADAALTGTWYYVENGSPDFPIYVSLTFLENGKCVRDGSIEASHTLDDGKLKVTSAGEVLLEGTVKTIDGVTVIESDKTLAALHSPQEMNVAPTKTITEADFIEEINKESFALFTVSNVAISEPELTNGVYICTVKYTTSISYQEGSTKDKTRDFVWIPALEKWCIPLESTIKQ